MTALEEYNASLPDGYDERIHAIIEATKVQAYRVAMRKAFMVFEDPDSDTKAFLSRELTNMGGNEDLL